MSTRAATFAPFPKARPDVKREMLFVFIAAVAAEIFLPALDKYQSSDPSTGSLAAELVWSAVYLAAGIRLYAMRDAIRPLISGSRALWAFVGLMMLSVVWSVQPHPTLIDSIELLGTTLVGLYLVARFTLPEFLALAALTFGAIALLSLALVFGAPGHGRIDYGGGAWAGIYLDKNNLGRAMALAVLSLVVLLVNGAGRYSAAVLGTLALCAVALVGSNSATALGDCIGVTALGMAMLVCRSKKFGVPARFFTVAAVASVAVAVFIFGFTPDAVFHALGRDGSLTGRTDFWPYLQQAISDRPILGFGYDAFFGSSVGSDYMTPYVMQSGGFDPYHAHNSVLQICLDAGFVGVAILAFLIVAGLWRSVAFLGREPGRFAVWPFMIVTYLVLGSYTETYFGNYNSLEWIFFTAALLYPLRHKMLPAVQRLRAL